MQNHASDFLNGKSSIESNWGLAKKNNLNKI